MQFVILEKESEPPYVGCYDDYGETFFLYNFENLGTGRTWFN
jgi:hypothetical protein